MANMPAFLDNPHAAEVFADAATGFFRWGNTIRITFESFRVDHSTSPGPVKRVVIGRLVMSIEAAEGMAKGLLEFINQQRTAQNPPEQSSAPNTKH